MNYETQATGIAYERLMMRAHDIKCPDPALGADRRIFYLLFHISQGVDLRQTGYMGQFLIIKEHVEEALHMILGKELHQHEQIGLLRVRGELETVFCEDGLRKVLDKSLIISERLHLQLVTGE